MLVPLVFLQTLAAVGVLADDVGSNPTGSGAPGGPLAQKMVDWLAQYGLWASLGAVLVGGAMWGFSSHAGNHVQAGKGKARVLGGSVGAGVIGLAPTIINTVFHAAR